MFGSGSLHLAAILRMFVLLPVADDGGVLVESEAPRALTPVEAANRARATERRATLERRRSSVRSRRSRDSKSRPTSAASLRSVGSVGSASVRSRTPSRRRGSRPGSAGPAKAGMRLSTSRPGSAGAGVLRGGTSAFGTEGTPTHGQRGNSFDCSNDGIILKQLDQLGPVDEQGVDAASEALRYAWLPAAPLQCWLTCITWSLSTVDRNHWVQ